MATPYSGRGATPYSSHPYIWRPLQQRLYTAAVAIAWRHHIAAPHTVTHITLDRVDTTYSMIYTDSR